MQARSLGCGSQAEGAETTTAMGMSKVSSITINALWVAAMVASSHFWPEAGWLYTLLAAGLGISIGVRLEGD